MGERAWWAYQCLPRDAWGEPPPLRELERAHGLGNAALRKLIWDVTVRPGLAQLEKLAAALQVTPEWLQFGRGTMPLASAYPVPRPPPPAGIQKLLDARSAVAGSEGLGGIDQPTERAFVGEAHKLLESGSPSDRRRAGK
jgi:hypothetical protein